MKTARAGDHGVAPVNSCPLVAERLKQMNRPVPGEPKVAQA